MLEMKNTIKNGQGVLLHSEHNFISNAQIIRVAQFASPPLPSRWTAGRSRLPNRSGRATVATDTTVGDRFLVSKASTGTAAMSRSKFRRAF
jgi:hypothetical protein